MRVGVVGAGSWGTALAKLCVEAGHQVRLWAFEVSRSRPSPRILRKYQI